MILSGGAKCKVGQKAAQSHILAPTVLEYTLEHSQCQTFLHVTRMQATGLSPGDMQQRPFPKDASTLRALETWKRKCVAVQWFGAVCDGRSSRAAVYHDRLIDSSLINRQG